MLPRESSTQRTCQFPIAEFAEAVIDGNRWDSSPKFFSRFAYSRSWCYVWILIGTIKNTLRSDVVNLLEGCDLSLEDVRTVYGQTFMPISILVKFHSPSAYEKAVKLITKNRLYRLDRADPSQWFKAKDYGAKTLLLEGLPRMASRDEVERFLSDWDYVPYNTLMITRPGVAEPIKTAVVPVSSPIQAMNMFLAKNRSYMGNNQVLVRVLQ
ncbi:unnamed protein product [Rhodiola kirilowii]